jgi:hypothetical protein
MGKIIMIVVLLFCGPVFGFLSWESCQDGYWITTYLLGGLSWAAPLLAWGIWDGVKYE